MASKTNLYRTPARPRRLSSSLAILFLAISQLLNAPPAYSQSQPDRNIPTGVVPKGPGATQESGARPNLSSGLSRVYLDWGAGMPAAELSTGAQGLEIAGERVFVTLIMIDQASAQAAIAAIPKLGGEVTSSFQAWIDAWVPIAELENVAGFPGTSLVREVMEVYHIDTPVAKQELESTLAENGVAAPAGGSYTTQGVAASGANAWHAKGWTGSGVKVALLDTYKWYQIAQSYGELPANVQIYSTAPNPINYSSQHGTACAEIIYDMAPGVNFTFSTPRTAVSMANLIIELAAQGNKIISSSYGWVGFEPGDGSGVLNNAIQYAYQTYGTLYVQAAGNMRQFHWDGNFNDPNGDYWHEFAPDYTINWFDPNLSTSDIEPLAAGATLPFIYLRWNSWPSTAKDYDLYLVRYNETTQQADVVQSSATRQTGTQPPLEALSYTIPQQGFYGVAVGRWSATGEEVLDIGGYGLPPFSIRVPARSLIDAANSPYALSISAVDVTSWNQEIYSSQGPTHGAGGGLGGGYFKPNMSSFANVDTWAYSGLGAYRFNGTSAATPHVAGAAALVLQAYPNAHAYHLWNHLVYFAMDRGTAGSDYLYGAGVLRMWNNPPSRVSSQTPPSQCANCAPGVKLHQFVPLVVK